MNMESYIENYLNTSEPVSFEAKAPMDSKQLEDFNIFNYTRRSTGIITVGFIVAFGCIIVGITKIASCEIFNAVTFFIEALVCASIPFITAKVMSANEVKSAYYDQNFNEYKFYNYYFVNIDRFTVTVVPYNFVSDAHENGEYFFLYISKQKAYIIPKNSFLINTPEEMRKFLYYKPGDRFTVHCKQ